MAKSTTVDALEKQILTSAVLTTLAKHVATRCRSENAAFINCKKKEHNSEKCFKKLAEITHCILNLFHETKESNSEVETKEGDAR